MKTRLLLLIVLIVLAIPTTSSQAQSPYETVKITAEDELELVGWYTGTEGLEAGENGLVPAVVLMHHSGASKEKWFDFMAVLTEANYAVLNIDLRGHGESYARGSRAGSPELWLSDTVLWLEWLRAQPGIDPDRISIVGASLGGDIGLNVMVADPAITSIVVISAGLEVQGITTIPAVEQITRPIYLVTTYDDAMGLEAVQGLVQVAAGEMQIRIYEGTACCTFLLDIEDDLTPSILAWLDRYNR